MRPDYRLISNRFVTDRTGVLLGGINGISHFKSLIYEAGCAARLIAVRFARARLPRPHSFSA